MQFGLQLAVPADPVSADATEVMANVDTHRTVKISTDIVVPRVIETDVRPWMIDTMAEPVMAKPEIGPVTAKPPRGGRWTPRFRVRCSRPVERPLKGRG